ncbi:MAG: maltose alpha-D-glucosyltransferase [Pirellulaceae bacterium]
MGAKKSVIQGRAIHEATKPASSRWFEEAVFYEVSVRTFFCADGDGIGDFAGLTQKLDYIQDLGATCIWLLPFFPSPLRDDGYDVADYRGVQPQLGGIEGFRQFLHAAHERGLRVAAEMVVNHTSDQHPWFQAARQAPVGSPLRDFYLWNPTPDRFREAEVLFSDVKRTNWSWDAQAQAFYWHRFFEHQPDLNFGQPRVQDEVLKVLRFWADLGIDGLCLNGASYLVKQDQTACEHLPETHAILRRFRQQLTGEYPDLMLQAGLNAWPADAHGYFGAGDECQLVPNLPLAQRLFLAVRQEDRQPLVDMLRQTPVPPAGCQWVTLLRNHDELTLTLATDEERDYLFREYAADPAMRRHAGILRRLAPLAENSRRRIELLFGLLFALPGAPLIYYGDEIGMGDNVFLGGRQSVRTPMQWSADRNAGFSTADFARLVSPPVMDPLFGYPAVNVAAQERDSSSLLHWMRRLIAVRRRSACLARGSLHPLEPANRRVVAFVRRQQTADGGEQAILVVANLSRASQPVELNLAEFSGLIPVEMFGRTPFPRIGAAPYLITLGPHGFYWFELQTTAEPAFTRRAPVETEAVKELPVVALAGEFAELFAGDGRDARQALERNVLPGFLRSQRWFGGKARQIEAIELVDWGRFGDDFHPAWLALVRVTLAGGAHDLYFLPLAIAQRGEAARLEEFQRPWVLARLAGPGGEALLVDALASDEICAALLSAIGSGQSLATGAGEIRFLPTGAYPRVRGRTSDPLPVVRGAATSSNSIVLFGRRLLLKVFRRLAAGVNPDVEVGQFLTDQAHFDRIPPVAGTIEYTAANSGEAFSLGILQGLVANQGDGWQHALHELSRYYERAWGRMRGPDPVPPDPRPLAELAGLAPPPAALETIGSYLHAATMLGRRTAEMHLALASEQDNADFTPEPLTARDMAASADEARHQAALAFAALAANLDRLPPPLADQARRLIESGAQAVERLLASAAPPQAVKTRIHGDYHLGQVLWSESDYILLDFEGEPTRSVDQRRAKFSPLRDVAGMLRSYHYAAYAGLFAYTQDRPGDLDKLAPWAELWQQWVGAAFLQSYQTRADEANFIPQHPPEFTGLLDRFVLGKALYELAYELNNRPDWVRIPLGGVWQLLENDLQPDQSEI